MTDLDIQRATVTDLSNLIRTKAISPVEVVDTFLERIHTVQPRINAFITVLDEQARHAARQAEKEIMEGHYRGPLHGIPFAAKDLFFTAGVKTTCGSRILAEFVPSEDATVISRLNDAGAILLGKTNMHEFAYGVTNLNEHYGNVRNPWNVERVSGGSSGGSAAALAALCAPLCLGTDTGGSIRIPSALCGTVGLKPTFGRVSKHSVYPLAWSLDHPGPMTRSVADSAIALTVMAGHDPKDPCSLKAPVPDYVASLTDPAQDLRVGVPDTFYFEDIEAEVKTCVEKAIGDLRTLVAEVREVHIPHLKEAAEATLMILRSEAVCCLEEVYPDRRDEIGVGVRARLDSAAGNLATDYIKAQQIRHEVKRRFMEVLNQVDVLVTPGVSITAPSIEDETVRLDGKNVPVTAALTYCTRIFNLVGLPSMSVPVGFSGAGLPIGIQIAGRPLDEATVLRVAHAYQSHIDQPKDWPALA